MDSELDSADNIISRISQTYPPGYENCSNFFEKLECVGKSVSEGCTELKQAMDPYKWVEKPDPDSVYEVIGKLKLFINELTDEAKQISDGFSDFKESADVAVAGAEQKLNYIDDRVLEMEDILQKFGFVPRRNRQFSDFEDDVSAPLNFKLGPFAGHKPLHASSLNDNSCDMSDFTLNLVQNERNSLRSNPWLSAPSPIPSSGFSSNSYKGSGVESSRSDSSGLENLRPGRVLKPKPAPTPPGRRGGSNSATRESNVAPMRLARHTPQKLNDLNTPQSVKDAIRRFGYKPQQQNPISNLKLPVVSGDSKVFELKPKNTPEEPPEIADTARKLNLISTNGTTSSRGDTKETADPKLATQQAESKENELPELPKNMSASYNIPEVPDSPGIDYDRMQEIFRKLRQ